VSVDLSTPDGPRALVARAEEFGRLDILVNNVGAVAVRLGGFTSVTDNCILPGPTRSRGVGDFVEALAKADGKSFEEFEHELFEKVRPTSLIKRFATPDEVASLAVYVASPLSSTTTGAALRVDGGVIKSAF